MQLSLSAVVEEEREKAKEYLCPICNYVIKTPCRMKCGHFYCVKCLTNSLKKNSEFPCPKDGEILSVSEISLCPNYPGYDVKCYCECRGYGCYWIGTVAKYYSQHINFCNIQNEFSDDENEEIIFK